MSVFHSFSQSKIKLISIASTTVLCSTHCAPLCLGGFIMVVGVQHPCCHKLPVCFDTEETPEPFWLGIFHHDGILIRWFFIKGCSSFLVCKVNQSCVACNVLVRSPAETRYLGLETGGVQIYFDFGP